MVDEENRASGDREELTSRDPTATDLAMLCRELNSRGASYLVVGGCAIEGAGYNRHTGDIDLLIDPDPPNEARAYRALEILEAKAVLQLDPGDVRKFTVVRVADEIVVVLMASASGITYQEAEKEILIREIDGVPVPFASSELLWRMKSTTHRAKDAADLGFLGEYFKARGEEPPSA